MQVMLRTSYENVARSQPELYGIDRNIPDEDKDEYEGDEVSFQWKNPDFLFKNPDLLSGILIFY